MVKSFRYQLFQIPSVLLAEDNDKDIQADVSDISRKAGNYTEKTDEERNCVASVEEEHVSGVVDNAAGEVMEEKEILLVPQVQSHLIETDFSDNDTLFPSRILKHPVLSSNTGLG